MRICCDAATGKILGAQHPSPAGGELSVRAAIEFPGVVVEEREVSEEEYQALIAAQADPKDAILVQISALEAMQTPRRLREATLTDHGKAWLENLENEIAALRAQLTNLL